MLRTSRALLFSRPHYGRHKRCFGDFISIKETLLSGLSLRKERYKYTSAIMTVPARQSMGFEGRPNIVETIRVALFGDVHRTLSAKGLQLNAFHGSAGFGKSKTLDALVAFNSNKTSNSDPVIINISFSGSFGVSNQTLTAGQLIASRMMLSYFVQEPSAFRDKDSTKGVVISAKDEFAKKLTIIEAMVVKATTKTTMDGTTDIIMDDSAIMKKCLELIRKDYSELMNRDATAPTLCIGLGVDELSKVTSVDLRDSIIRLICCTADSQLQGNRTTFNAIFSTLHLTMFDKAVSQRPINFIPLPLLDESVSHDLLAKHIRESDFSLDPSASLSDSYMQQYRYLIRLLAIMSAGHCRTIETMIEAAEFLRSHVKQFTLAELLETVASSPDVKLKPSPQTMSLAILKPVIDLEQIRAIKKDQAEGERLATASLDETIARGNLFGTVDTEGMVHITIPPMAFRSSVANLKEANRIFTRPGVSAARELLHLSGDENRSLWDFAGINYGENGESAESKSYETTHRHVEQFIECLYRGLYEKTTMAVTDGTGSTPSLYANVTAQCGPLASTPYQLCAPAMEVFRPPEGQQFPGHESLPVLRKHLYLPQSADYQTLGRALGKINCMIIPAWDEQRGYSYLRVVRDKEGCPFAILTEVSYVHGNVNVSADAREGNEQKLMSRIINSPKTAVKMLPWELLGLDSATRVLHVHLIYGTHSSSLTRETTEALLRQSGAANAMVITASDLNELPRGLSNLIPFLMHRRAQETVAVMSSDHDVGGSLLLARSREVEDAESQFEVTK